jgi:hypothetical protein
MCLRRDCDPSSAGLDKWWRSSQSTIKEWGLGSPGYLAWAHRVEKGLKFSTSKQVLLPLRAFNSPLSMISHVTILHAGANSAMTTVMKGTSQRHENSLYTLEHLDPGSLVVLSSCHHIDPTLDDSFKMARSGQQWKNKKCPGEYAAFKPRGHAY